MKKYQTVKNTNRKTIAHLINEDEDDITLYVKAKKEFKKNPKTYSLKELKNMYKIK